MMRLLPALVANGHQVSALIIHQGGAAPSAISLASRGVRVITRTWHETTQQRVSWILNSVKTLNPDVFVPNISVAGWLAAKWIRAAGIPTIATYRGDDAFHNAMVDEFVAGSPEWAVSGVVCVSERLKNLALARAPEATKVCVIPSGVPIQNLRAKKSQPVRVAYLGRLVDEAKQVTKTLTSLIEFVRSRPEIRVTLYGDGPRRQALQQQIAECRLQEQITLAGYVPPDQIQDRLQDEHILVLLSDNEGLPGAVMDAMACGVVPICTRLPGIEELVIHNQTGLLVEDRQSSFQATIGALVDSPSRWDALRAAAHSHVASHYSLQSCVTRWEDVCALLLTDAPARRAIETPIHIDLPPVNPNFATEDLRKANWRFIWRRMHDFYRQIINRGH
jgi:glycosyltransferase involved in cell wall biosynthesis